MSVMDLSDQVVLVTGAGGSIGQEVAAQLAEAGAHIGFNGRSQPPLDAALEHVRKRAPTRGLHAVAADLTDIEQTRELIQAMMGKFGRLDGVVHCAVSSPGGIGGLFEQTDPRQFSALMDQSLVTLMNLCHASLPALKQGGGSIVVFVSDAGKVAMPNQTMIGATRAAAMMFVRSLALEVSAFGVRCNCVSPTYVKDTAIYDRVLDRDREKSRAARAAARAGLGLPNPGDLAALTVFLCSPLAAHLTGQVISVNGGLTAA